jgi:broad specificity phosphatase PhoE
VTRLILLRHAEPLVADGMPTTHWPLTDEGRTRATALGRSLADTHRTTTTWTSPARRASETAALVVPSVAFHVREELSEVKKPWYLTTEEHAKATARYLEGEDVHGWEGRGDVVARLSALETDFGPPADDLIIVSHGVLLTIWLDHQIGLSDPYRFWSNLRMPDAWLADFENKSLHRLVAR